MKKIFQKVVGSTIKVPVSFLRGDLSSEHSIPSNQELNSKAQVSIPGNDLTKSVIRGAGMALLDAIQEIMADNIGLNDEGMSGFFRLLELLESDDDGITSSTDMSFIISSGGMFCLSILIRHLNYIYFREICSEIPLASSLLTALRLLRMMEVKLFGKPLDTISSKSDSTDRKEKKSWTSRGAERVCLVLVRICSLPKALKQQGDFLVKLFCFPLSIQPVTGIHLQRLTATIDRKSVV